MWKIQYFGLCINEFARKYRLKPQIAHNYLQKYKGLQFLQDNYEVEHTLALDDTIHSLHKVCAYNGGTL
ncbi:MAG: DUF3791 domain-containing protein [Paludibacteraceae bacterium]|nr:DUF3791 domain-containing protein [Paludibacteraceae bacterium]